jgi:hypothetical protein
MKTNNNFKYQIKDNRLWYNNTEITNKQANNPRDWFFILREESPRHWVRLKVKKDEQWLKAFAKLSDENGESHYFEQWHEITDLNQPIKFHYTCADEVVKQADGRWVKVNTK